MMADAVQLQENANPYSIVSSRNFSANSFSGKELKVVIREEVIVILSEQEP